MSKIMRFSWVVDHFLRRLPTPPGRVAGAISVARALLVREPGILTSAVLLAASCGIAQASPNLVLDGNFSQASLTPSGSGYSSFELGSWQDNGSGPTYTGTVADWTMASGAYNYVFTSGSATALGSYGTLTLADGAAIGTAPGGGNFIGADGDFGTQAISQTISGLVIGAPTTVSFSWAAAQQSGASGSTTQYWQVSLGSSAKDTTTYDLAQGGFSGWMQATMSFIPTSTSEVLSFLAVGTGSPPFLLLANVSVAEPEPGTLVVMLTGLAGLGALSRRRRRSRERRIAA
jgi:hypothetical protein